MERPKATRVPGGVGEMDETLCDYIVLLSLDKWLDARGMVPAAARTSTRMPARAPASYSDCGCLGFLYNEALLA